MLVIPEKFRDEGRCPEAARPVPALPVVSTSVMLLDRRCRQVFRRVRSTAGRSLPSVAAWSLAAFSCRPLSANIALAVVLVSAIAWRRGLLMDSAGPNAVAAADRLHRRWHHLVLASAT
jgi:hypothetical protein